MIRKLWVDDERPAPDDTWEVALDADQARQLIAENEYEVVSLDYVLKGWDSGFDVLMFMHNENRWPIELRSHSGGSLGRYEIISYAEEHGPEGMVIVDDPQTLG